MVVHEITKDLKKEWKNWKERNHSTKVFKRELVSNA